MHIISVERRPEESAIDVAKRAAESHGTKLTGNLRWYRRMGPAYRCIGTADGREIRVNEPGGGN